MKIELEDIYAELNKVGQVLISKEKIGIVDTLNKHGECTISQISNALRTPQEEIMEHLSKLDELLMVEHQLTTTHPLTKEGIYYLTGRGKRYYDALRKIVEFEFAVLESAVEKTEDDFMLLIIIDEFGEVNRIDLDNLTYILSSLGHINDSKFIVDYSGLHSWKLKASIEQMIREGLIRDMGTSFQSYRLTRKGKTLVSSNSSREREIIGELKRNIQSPFRFALYCRILDTEDKSEVFKSAKRLGLAEDEIASYERLYNELKQLNIECLPTLQIVH